MLHRALPAVVLSVVSALARTIDTPAPPHKVFQYSPEVRVAYDVQGRPGLPVVLVHGLAASKEAWDLLLPGLLDACQCRVYRLDLRGHGETSAPNDDGYSVAENAAIVRAFMAHLKLRDAVLVGHSYGGAVALQVALDARRQDPGLLRSLILMSTPAMEQRFPFALAQQKHEAYGALIDRVMPARMRAFVVVHGRNYRNTSGTRKRIELYTYLWRDPARTRAARRTARQFLDGGGLSELAARNHDTGVPTLVVAGKHDHMIPVRRAEQLAASIPGSRFAVIPHTGHAMHEDAPEAVIPLLAEFLKTTSARRTAAARP